MLKFPICVLLAGLAFAGCGEKGGGSSSASVRQTHFPGQVTAGGGTSGEVLARSERVKEGSTTGGTPGIAGGSGGTAGGPATAGSFRESGEGPASGATAPAGQSR